MLRTLILIVGWLTFFQASQAWCQIVVAKRIDGRPPGHPLDSGSPFDPIMDDALRATVGVSASSATAACVIRVPDWIPDSEKTDPRANYYLYYSGHHGTKISLAWAESITGQWHIFNEGSAPDRAWGAKGNYSGDRTPGDGVLDREHHGERLFVDSNTCLDGKLHFVDLYADRVNRRIIMYFHNLGRCSNGVATSRFGLNFNMPDQGGESGQGIRNVRVTEWYLRSFQLEGQANGQPILARFGAGRSAFWRAPLFTATGEPASHENADSPGGWWKPSWPGDPTPEDPSRKWTIQRWWRELEDAANPLAGTITAPELANPERSFQVRGKHEGVQKGRHFAFYHNPMRERNRIYVFKTNSRDLPESVTVLVLDLTGLSESARLDPAKWKLVRNVERVLLKPEKFWEGIDRAYQPSNNGVGNGYQLRDPFVFEDRDGKLYLFYSGKGEANIGVAELTISPEPTNKSLRVTAPHGRHPLLAGNVYPIGWQSHGPIARVDLACSIDGKDWVSIAEEVENREYYLWTVPDTASHKAVVRVRETDGEIVAESEPFTITADKALGIISPTRQTVYVAGQVHYPAYWSTGPMEYITFEYSVDGRSWIKITDRHPDTSEKAVWNAPAFAWKVPMIDSRSVRLRVRETDGSAIAVSEPFTVVAP